MLLSQEERSRASEAVIVDGRRQESLAPVRNRIVDYGGGCAFVMIHGADGFDTVTVPIEEVHDYVEGR